MLLLSAKIRKGSFCNKHKLQKQNSADKRSMVISNISFARLRIKHHENSIDINLLLHGRQRIGTN